MATVPFGENGGFIASNFFLFVPTISTATDSSAISIFDVSSFNDPNDGSSYSYRAEDISVARVPVVRRIILVYTDLGICNLTVAVSGTNDNNQVISSSAQTQVGTTGATGQQFTKFVDLQFTGFRPQLTINRAAGAGPLSIVSATMVGEVEDTSF